VKRLIPLLALVALLAPAPAGAAAPLRIVAAENVWGSIAAQLGGPYVQVTSLITNPATDPHAYEPNAIDARTLAGARLVIVNGIGYDPWAPKLLAANPVKGRVLLTVGDVVGVKPGGNPHRWYAPGDVAKVIAAIALAYERLDPPHARQFAQLEHVYETRVLSAYHAEIAVIRRLFHGAPVGASESIFAPLAQALGLDLVTPPSFLKAISEGTEPTAGDKRAVDRQVATRAIKVWVYNSQNSTPDVARITEAARKRGIPVTTITETLTPPTASFQDWQVAQLRALRAALQRAGAR
jgi:zinc/manganese transport system substrate-binding protein